VPAWLKIRRNGHKELVTFQVENLPHGDAAPPVPGAGEPLFLGDLAMAVDTCAAEAAEAGVPLAEHAAHLVVHGVLHLLEYDHAEPEDEQRMRRREAQLLERFRAAEGPGPAPGAPAPGS
jgi:probable rRNA maturation factor